MCEDNDVDVCSKGSRGSSEGDRGDRREGRGKGMNNRNGGKGMSLKVCGQGWRRDSGSEFPACLEEERKKEIVL